MKRVLVSLSIAVLFAALIAVWARSLRQIESATAANGLPTLVYLGDSGSFEVPPGHNFIVKRANPFRFDFVPGTTYVAAPDERVWQSFNSGGAPPPHVDDETIIDDVPAGCVVGYVVIDDDLDGRRNDFRVNGNVIVVVDEGMVSEGQFVVPEAGTLSYFAADSSGFYVDFCRTQSTATPTATATAAATSTATATAVTATNTPTATAPPTTATATATLSATLTTTPTATATRPLATTTATATAVVTATPDATATPIIGDPTPSPTPTDEPRLNACLRINFELSGDVAQSGTYVVRELGGRELVSWRAEAGWQDSGWIRDIDISFPSVYVEVFFYGDDGSIIRMDIVNPAPDTHHGWLSRGQCHALEVAWPQTGQGIVDPSQPAETIWPGQEPTPSARPGHSLGR